MEGHCGLADDGLECPNWRSRNEQRGLFPVGAHGSPRHSSQTPARRFATVWTGRALRGGKLRSCRVVRRELLKRQSKYEKQACFHLSNNISTALGLLKVDEHEITRSLLGVGQGDQVTVVTATLEDADSLLCSDAKQGAPGLIHTGAGDAVLHILHSLWKAAGCNGDGKKTESK